HTCITGLRHQVRVPAIPMYMDAVIATQDLIGGFRPRIGEHHVRVIGVMGFPMESVPEVLGFLNRLPVEYRWSTRFIFLDPASAERALRVYRRNWFQKRHGLLGLLKESFNFGTVTFANKDAVAMAQDADDAVAEASANVVRFGYFTCNVLLFDPDRDRLDATAPAGANHLTDHAPAPPHVPGRSWPADEHLARARAAPVPVLSAGESVALLCGHRRGDPV